MQRFCNGVGPSSQTGWMRIHKKRVELVEGDVLKINGDPVDAVMATNFSYYLFKTRSELKNYFSTARRHLVPEGYSS